VWFLLFAISSHKYVIAFCISLQFVTSGVKPLISVVYVSTFSFISPVGAAIGIALSEVGDKEVETQTVLITVLQGLATGTLLYVVFFEVIEKERQKGTSGLIQVTFTLLGFAVMLGLECVELFSRSPNPVSGDVINCDINQDSFSLPANITCQDGTRLSLALGQ